MSPSNKAFRQVRERSHFSSQASTDWYSAGSRQALKPVNSVRWAGDSPTHVQRGFDWKPPQFSQSPTEVIQHEKIPSSSGLSSVVSNVVELPTPAERDPIELPTIEIISDRYYRSTKDWTAPQSNYLSLRKGDLVRISRMPQEGLYSPNTSKLSSNVFHSVLVWSDLEQAEGRLDAGRSPPACRGGS
jgi:hypothetical protein